MSIANTFTWMLIAPLFVIAPNWKRASYFSIGEWMSKLWHMEYHYVKSGKNIDIYNTMDMSQNYYGNWKRSYVEYILYESTFIQLWKWKLIYIDRTGHVLPKSKMGGWQRL